VARRTGPGPLASALHAHQLELAQPRVERWFDLLTDRRLRRGVFGSVGDLTQEIRFWAKNWNDDPKRFIWTKAADEIIEKVRRGRAALHQVKTATGPHWEPASLCAVARRRPEVTIGRRFFNSIVMTGWAHNNAIRSSCTAIMRFRRATMRPGRGGAAGGGAE